MIIEDDVKPTVLEPGTDEPVQTTDLERDLSPAKEPVKPEDGKIEKSSRSSVEKALDKIQAEGKAETEKPEKVEKVEKPVEAVKENKAPEKVQDVAANADDKAGKEVPDKPRQSERRDYPEPPSRFMPREKELWRNAPLPVQQAVARMAQEHEAEISQYRQSHEEYESVREYAERAKQGGTNLRAALDSYVGMEDALRSNPPEGFKAILSNMNMQPQQAIANIMHAFNINPMLVAQHIAENPHMYAPQQRVQQPQVQQQQQPIPEVQELKKQIEDMRHQITAENIIRPFAETHDRYFELEEDIAFFLGSGKIPASLSPMERLEAAYDMAERINPSSRGRAAANQDYSEDLENSSQRRAEPDLNGIKSVKGSPSNGADHTPKRAYKNPRDAVKAAMSSLGM